MAREVQPEPENDDQDGSTHSSEQLEDLPRIVVGGADLQLADVVHLTLDCEAVPDVEARLARRTRGGLARTGLGQDAPAA